MRIRVVAVGTKVPAWVDAAVADYDRRLPADWRIDWKPVKAEPRAAGGSPAQWVAREGARLREAIPAGTRLVVLDQRGTELDSPGLAERAGAWRRAGTPVALAIGGPDGLDPTIRAQAAETLRLSALTLPHALVRVVLAEQWYRAWSIAGGHPYHRE